MDTQHLIMLLETVLECLSDNDVATAESILRELLRLLKVET